MESKLIEKITVGLLLLMIIGYGVNTFFTRTALKDIQADIKVTSQSLEKVNKKIGHVVNSLEGSANNIDSILINIESSKIVLNDLINKTGKITAKEKEKIEESISNLEETKRNIEEEKKKTEELIDQLNTTITE